ncbi:unnamed protein product [Pylaiella littoralis]
MRGVLLCAIVALCTLADNASAERGKSAAERRVDKSSRSSCSTSRRARSSTAGDRDLRGKATATAVGGRSKCQDKEVHSEDGCSSIKRGGSSTFVVGSVWKEEGLEREHHGRAKQGRGRRWDEEDEEDELEEDDDFEDNDVNDEESDDDWGDDDDDNVGGGDFGYGGASLDDDEEEDSLEEEEEEEEGDFSEKTIWSEETEEEQGATTAHRQHGRNGGRRSTGPGSPRASATSARDGSTRSNSNANSSQNPNRRAYYDDGGSGRSRSEREARSPPPSTRKAKAKGGGVVKSVGKATGRSMKAMVHALQPKSVGLGEILDTWKIEQIIGKPPGRVTKCAATVEFRRDGTVATSFDGRESVSDFTFRAHAWPRACTIEFEAKAFQGPWDEEPVWKIYKGSFSRKLLDPKIIMLDGTIYDVMGKMMWKRRVKSGKFTARRRPSRLSSRGEGGGDGGGGKSSKKSYARWSNAEEEEEEEDVGKADFTGGSRGAEAGAKARASSTGRNRKKRRSSSSWSRRSRSDTTAVH